MTTAPQFLDIPFVGERSGRYPLTWGQCWVWRSVASRAPFYADMGGSYTVPVPEDGSLRAVADALSALLVRYETFRCRYGVDANGTPHQLVLAVGQLRAEVRDFAPDKAAAGARFIEDEFNRLPFTLPELPLRATVVTADGLPRFVVLCAFHLAMDCHGMAAVLEDFAQLLGGRANDPDQSAPQDLRHPADRALEEQGAEGVRRSALGAKFWAQELAAFPDDLLPYAGHRPEQPRYQTFEMHSAALCAASATLAAELRVTAASVILGAAAGLLGLRSANGTVGIIVAASHRYDPMAMDYAGTLVQGVPTALTVSESSLRGIISHSHRAGMLAALAGHCHPDEADEMLRAAHNPQAVQAKMACVVNVNLPDAADPGRVAADCTGAEAKQLLAQSRYGFVEGTPVENERFYLAAHGDTADFSLTLRADTAVFRPEEILQFLKDLEIRVLDCLA